MIETIVHHITEHGPKTVPELSVELGLREPFVRQELASEVFKKERVGKELRCVGRLTCNKRGQYYLGDPTKLNKVG